MKSQLLVFLFVLICEIAVSLPTVNRISNGQIATPGQFTYAVSIQQLGVQQITRGHRCGGALVTRQHVLTAASCLFDIVNGSSILIAPSQYRVFAGSSLLTNDTSANLIRTIQNFTIHPEYTGLPALANNLAILTLLRYAVNVFGNEDPSMTKFVNFSSFRFKYYRERKTLSTAFPQNVVTPLSLPRANSNTPDFTVCTVAGWGGINSTTTASTQLRFTNKYVYNQNLCASLYNNVAGALNIIPSMVCAASYDILSSGCAGDDGNPLVCDGVFTGVLSLSDGCRSSSYPEVYTRVSNYTSWIRTVSGSPSLSSSGILLMITFLFVLRR